MKGAESAIAHSVTTNEDGTRGKVLLQFWAILPPGFAENSRTFALAIRPPARHAGGMAKSFAKLVALPKPKRSWFQFRLRTLFVLVAVSAVPCVWLAWNMDARRRVELTKQRVLELGGTFATENRCPKWIEKLVGHERTDLFERIARIDLTQWTKSHATDTDLAFARLIPGRCRQLRLDGAAIGDTGLEQLAAHRR